MRSRIFLMKILTISWHILLKKKLHHLLRHPMEGVLQVLLIFGALALVLAVLIVLLVYVRKVLVKIAGNNGFDVEVEKSMPIWKSFAKNQFAVFMSVVVMFLLGSYFAFGYMMQIGVDQGYEPIQPIHFSHKIHAGENGIDCKYCH